MNSEAISNSPNLKSGSGCTSFDGWDSDDDFAQPRANVVDQNGNTSNPQKKVNTSVSAYCQDSQGSTCYETCVQNNIHNPEQSYKRRKHWG